MISWSRQTALSDDGITNDWLLTLFATKEEFSCCVCNLSKLFFLIREILDCWECKRWVFYFWVTIERLFSYYNRSWFVTKDLLTSYFSFVFIIQIITTLWGFILIKKIKQLIRSARPFFNCLITKIFEFQSIWNNIELNSLWFNILSWTLGHIINIF